MPSPAKPKIDYSYTGFQQEFQDNPFPGTQLDNDLANLATSSSQTIDALADIRRSDGALKNSIVTADSLDESLLIGLKTPTVWAASTRYAVLDTVIANTGIYRCLVSHESADFDDDFAAGYWQLIFELSPIVPANLPAYQFLGDGVTEDWPVGVNPGTLNNIIVSVGGSFQLSQDISLIEGDTNYVRLSPAVPSLVKIEIRTLVATAALDVPADGSVGIPQLSGEVADAVALAVTAVQPDELGYLNVKSDFDAVGNGIADDTAEVIAAVAAALAKGADLYWPPGAYLTTGSIPNFHSVNHLGPGIVKRGSVLFYVDPRGSQSNTINVATTGDSANDGLSASEPVATFQNAFDALKNYGPVLDGIWNVVVAAGTYTISAGQQTHTTQSKNRVVIRGPVAGHPNVPTCLVDGGGNGTAYAHGLSASGNGVRAEFRDIKFQNFTEASGNTRIGVVGENESDFYTSNVHSVACSWAGVYIFNTVRARVSGGIQDGAANVGAACTIVNSSQCTVGYNASSTADGPVIKNAGIGVYCSRGTQGHLDWVNVQDCGYGLQIGESSRVDTIGVDFKRNTIGIRCFTGGVFGEGGALNVWNNGTADANVTNTAYSASAGNSDELLTSQSWSRVAYDRTTRSLSGVTPTVLTTPYIIPAYRLQGVGKQCRVHVLGIFTTVTAASTVTVNFGGMAFTVTVPAAGSSIAFEIDVTLYEVAGGYRAIGKIAQGLNAVRFGTASAGFVNSSNQTISVAATLANAGDSMNLYRTDVYLMG